MSSAVSNRVLVDLEPPTAGIVYDIKPCGSLGNCTLGTAVVTFHLPTAVVAARWEDFVDAESGVARYAYCAGSTPLACDLAPMVESGNETEAELALTGGVAEHESTLCFSVEAVNGVELRSERVSGPCVTVDNTPPTVKFVRIGSDPFVHMDEVSDGTVLFGSIFAGEDWTEITVAEFCYSYTNVTAPLDLDEANFTIWSTTVCDATPIKTANPDNTTITRSTDSGATSGGKGGGKGGGKSQSEARVRMLALRRKFIFGTEAAVASGSTIFLGARSRNELGLWSEWKWSEPTRIGATAAKVDSTSEESNVILDTAIPDYGALEELR